MTSSAVLQACDADIVTVSQAGSCQFPLRDAVSTEVPHVLLVCVFSHYYPRSSVDPSNCSLLQLDHHFMSRGKRMVQNCSDQL